MDMADIPIYGWIWIIVTLISLAFGAYFDWKERIIPDKVWLFQLGGGTIGIVFWVSSGPSFTDLILMVVNFILALILSLAIIFTGAMAGGDIKGIFSTGISFPFAYSLFGWSLSLPSSFPGLFSVILNFFLIYVFLALGFFVMNLTRLVKGEISFANSKGTLKQQLVLLFEGCVVSTENISQRKFYNPAEVLVDDHWELYTPEFDGMMTDEEFEEMEINERAEMLDAINKTGKEKIWIRPQNPGIFFLFLSFLLSLTVGTILGPVFGHLVS